jgi:hypothetical protein
MGEGMLARIGNALRGNSQQEAARLASKMDEVQERKRSYSPTGDERKVMKFIQEAKRVRETTLDAFEAIWSKAILYTAGVQHLRFIASMRTYEPTKEDEWVPLPTHNFIQPKVQRIVDMFTRNHPGLYVEPNSRNMDDVMAGELGTKLIRAIHDNTGMRDKYDLLVNWAAVTGNAFSKSFIDTSTQTARKVPRYREVEEPIMGFDQQPVINMHTGQPALTKRWVEERNPETGEQLFDEQPEGDVRTDILGPLGMTVPLAAQTWSDIPWVMETQLYSTILLKEMYPDKADAIPDTGQIVSTDLYQYRITSLLTSGLHGVLRTLDPWSMEGFSVVNQYERRPDRDFPGGILVIETDGVPLYLGDLEGNDFSYEHFGYYRVPGRFWHRGVVEDMMPIQDQINKLEQFLQLNDAHNVNPTTYVPSEAEIAPGALNNRPGAKIEYNWPYKPDTVEGVSMPPEIVQRRQLYIQDMEDVSGVRNVLMGDAPPNVSAGVALNRLGEEAEGLFSPIQKRFETFIERTGSKQLQLAQKYYSSPRYFATQNDMGTWEEIKDFVGADLRGNTRIRVEAGSYKARSRAGKQQTLLDLLGAGLLPGVMMDPEQTRSFLQQFGYAEFAPPQSLDSRRAEWENQMLIRSSGWERIQRMPGDDDVIHMETHTRFMKTDSWLHLPETVQQRHLIHQMEHLLTMEQTGGRAIVTGAEDAGMAEEAAAAEAQPQDQNQSKGGPEADSGATEGGTSGQE